MCEHIKVSLNFTLKYLENEENSFVKCELAVMSLNFLADRFMSCEDDEFVLKIDADIRDYLNDLKENR